MWVRNSNTATQTLYNDAVLGDLADDPVEDLPGDERGVVFDGPVQVTDAVGEALCDRYETIEPHEAES